MSAAPTLPALLARIEAAEGPDRELDQDIYGEIGGCVIGADGMRDAYRAPAYTASIDAAAALVERNLPGWQWSTVPWDDELGPAFVFSPRATYGSNAATFALALCAAVVRALIAIREIAPAERSVEHG